MPTTTDYSFGDVVLVPFPFTDQSAIKKRPAVIVSSANYHRSRADVILMAVTSQSAPARQPDLRIQGWEEAGLLGDPAEIREREASRGNPSSP